MLDFDFTQFENERFRKEFKEDSVREFIIAPLLQELGFKLKDSKEAKNARLQHKLSHKTKADFQIGSNKKLEADLTPDYTLYVDSKIYCILDAKAPDKDISKGSSSYKQALSYAVGFECGYFALCNGRRFSIFALSSQKVVLDIDLAELDSKLALLQGFFLNEQIAQNQARDKKPDSWYLEREIPKAIAKPKKQEAKRHYGCTAYFTRQSWDIVDRHIKAFSSEGDVVLDPFGGSGVTAIESMMNNRLGIHTDLNPLSIFMVKAMSAECDLGELQELASGIIEEFEALKPKNEREAKALLKNAKHYPNALDLEFGKVATQKEQDSTLWLPKDEALLWTTKNLTSLYQLFSKTQLAELALLRKLIFTKTMPSRERAGRARKRALRYSLMLAFYNTLSMCNLTFHETNSRKGGGGIILDSTIAIN